MTSERGQLDSVGLLLGFLLGAVLGVLGLALAPVLVILMPVLGLLASVTALRESPVDKRRSAGGAGLLLGMAAVFAYGVANTYFACQGTDDFCWNADIVPFLALTVLTSACGVALTALTWLRSRP